MSGGTKQLPAGRTGGGLLGDVLAAMGIALKDKKDGTTTWEGER